MYTVMAERGLVIKPVYQSYVQRPLPGDAIENNEKSWITTGV